MISVSVCLSVRVLSDRGHIYDTIRDAILTCTQKLTGWLGSRVVIVLDSGAEGLGSNRSRDAVG